MMRGSSSARTIVVFGAFALFLRGLDTVAAETLVEGRDYLPFLKFPATSSPVYQRDFNFTELSEWQNLPLALQGTLSGFPIGSDKYIDIEICGCGLLTVGTPLTSSYRREDTIFLQPSSLPIPTYDYQYESDHGAVLAPFWSSSDPASTRISTVGYEVHTSDGGEESANLLQRVSSFISNSSFLKSRTDSTEIEPFSGTWMAVVHWDKLIPFIDYLDADQPHPGVKVNNTNTFQALLVTDGTRSYTVFSYRCGYLSWSEARRGSYSSVVGYDIRFSNYRSQYTNHPSTYNTLNNTAHLISCLNYPDSEWSNVVYQLGPEVPNVTYTASDKKTPPAPSNLSSTRGYCAAAGYTGCCDDATEDLGTSPFLSCRGSSQACYCDQQCYQLKECCVDISDICPFKSSLASANLGITFGTIFGVTLFLLVVFVSLLLVLCFCGPLRRIYTKVPTGETENTS